MVGFLIDLPKTVQKSGKPEKPFKNSGKYNWCEKD